MNERIILIQSQIDCISILMQKHYDNIDIDKWDRKTTRILTKIFGENSKNVELFNNISYSPMFFSIAGNDDGSSQFQSSYLRGLTEAKGFLESCIEEIQEEEIFTGGVLSKNIEIEMFPEGKVGAELIKYWLGNTQSLSKQEKFVENFEKYLIDEETWIYHIESLVELVKKIDRSEHEKILLERMINYFNNRVNDFNNFYSCECCIKYLLVYYGEIRSLHGLDKEFVQVLAQAIQYSGDKGDSGYAYEGLNMVREYIGALNEDLLEDVLELVQDNTDNMRDVQIKAVVNHADLSIAKKEVLTAYYIDRWYLEKNYREFIENEIYSKYRDEYTIITPIDKMTKIALLHKNRNDEYIINFKIRAKEDKTEMEWTLEDNQGIRKNILNMLINYRFKYIKIMADDTSIHNYSIDNSSNDKRIDEGVGNKLKAKIQEITLGKYTEEIHDINKPVLEYPIKNTIEPITQGAKSMKKLQVFISSTYIDLIEDRQAAVEAILDAGHIPAGMELFKSGKKQMETIKKWIDESDVYMLILGGRYGSIEPESGKSYTHLEYEYALEKKMPVFAVVIKEESLQNKIAIKTASGVKVQDVVEIENSLKHTQFKELVLGNVNGFFNDVKDIKIEVHRQINEIVRENKVTGWVREETYLEELNRLRKENEQFRNILNKISK